MNEEKPFTGRSISIRTSIFIYFTFTALMGVLLIGISLYARLSNQLSDTIKEENIGLVNQVNSSMDSYLRGLMKLSDSAYYGVIKKADLAENSINQQLMLLYDSNKDHVENIALISGKGELLEAVPAARLKQERDITEESWFKTTLEKTENIHFFNPHVQYIFDIGDNQYKWVISLSRAVEINKAGRSEQALLLMDMTYSGLEQVLDNVTLGNKGYIYMTDSEGSIIWHPRGALIDSGRVKENNIVNSAYNDGSTEEFFAGEKRTVTVKSVGYTGWKIIGVTPSASLSLNSVKTRIFFAFAIGLILFLLTLINSYISLRITDPIQELEKSVNELENGNMDADIYVGGSYEIQHLGNSVIGMRNRIRTLMQDIVKEHESKRRSEFNTLQSQINPHFLYNTLDIIVWMIENEKQSEAVRIVTALARFFRISLSRGRNIITLEDELEHVRNYLMIQHMRFKNKFDYRIDAGDEVMKLASLKLMLQPLVENAIYHGMEFMDGDGLIQIKAFRDADELYISVKDNGLGMTAERVESLLSEEVRVSSSKGSGIGVKNVNERIKLYFGEKYGLRIISEPDEGTVIVLHLPAKEYESIREKS